jgi:hypothetical protein
MEALIKFKNNVIYKLNIEGCDFLDLYYTLTISCDVKLITNQLSETQRYNFLIKCGISPKDINYYNHFDTNHQNTLDYIIAFAKYDAIRHKIYAFLFSLFASNQICDINYLLEDNI